MSTLKSQNFLISLFTLIALVFAYFGVDLPKTPEEIAGGAVGVSFAAYFTSVLIPNFAMPIIKIWQSWKEFGFNLGFLKSKNFWTQAVTCLLLLVEIFTPIASFWSILAIQAVNLIYHLFFDKKEAPRVVGAGFVR